MKIALEKNELVLQVADYSSGIPQNVEIANSLFEFGVPASMHENIHKRL